MEPRNIVNSTSPHGADCHCISFFASTSATSPDPSWRRLSAKHCWHSSRSCPRASAAADRSTGDNGYAFGPWIGLEIITVSKAYSPSDQKLEQLPANKLLRIGFVRGSGSRGEKAPIFRVPRQTNKRVSFA
eukprot:4009705-Pleurochrysis_carterae.AAC.2